jgi:Zn-dependent peptidase ImmA (M78 family)
MLLHRRVDSRLLNRPEVFKRAEKQAHRFAGAFLLPPDTFGRSIYVPTLSVLETQKRIWGVSMAGMLTRLVQLGLIERDHGTRIWRSYSRQGMRLREPLDDIITPEQPQVLRRAYEMLVRERALTREQLVASLAFDADELQALLGLPMSFARERTLGLRLHDDAEDSSADASASGARVLNWRERT